jgi:hypothetical protein
MLTAILVKVITTEIENIASPLLENIKQILILSRVNDKVPTNEYF